MNQYVPRIQNLKIMRYRNKQLVKSRVKHFQLAYRPEFEKLADMLEDDFSRKTLKAVLKYRRTFHARALKGVIVLPQYFQESILKPVENEVFIDGGAYAGETIAELYKFGGGIIGRRSTLGSLMRTIEGN